MSAKRRLRCFGSIFVLGLAVVLLGQAARANVYTWNVNTTGSAVDGSGNWNTGSNWWNSSSDVAWTNLGTDSAQFGYGSGGTTPYSVTLQQSTTAGGVVFQNQAYTLTGSTLYLAGTSPTITVNASSATIGSILAGSNGLTKAGSGTLTLTSANTYTGGTTVTSGLLILNGGNNVNPSHILPQNTNLTITGGTVSLQGTGSAQNVIYDNGGGTIAIGAGGLLTSNLSGANESNNIYNVVLSGGTMASTNGGAFFTNAPIIATGNTTSTISANVGPSASNGTLSVSVSGGSGLLVSGNVINSNGTSSLTLSGSGLMTLTGLSTYTGSTTISGGTLQIAGAGSLAGGNYAAAISNATALVMNTVSNQTFSGAISGAGSLTQSGLSTLTLTNAGNIYSGGTYVLAGTLLVSGVALPTGGTLNVAAGGTFSTADGTGRTSTVGGLTLGGGGLAMDWGDTLSTSSTATTAGYVNLAPSGSFSSGTPYTLVKAAGGLNGATGYLLSNTNYTGALSIASTSVTLTPTTATPLTTAYWYGGQVTGGLASMGLSNGALSNWSTGPAYAATGVVPGSATNVVFSTSTGATQQSNIVLGANMAVNSLTFSDTNAVTINADGNALTLMSSGSGTASAINVNSSATINSTLNLGAAQTWTVAAGTLTVGGPVNGNFGLTTAGSGAVLIAGNNTYTGATNIAAGAVTLSGQLNGSNVAVSGATTNFNETASGFIAGAAATFTLSGGSAVLAGQNTYGGITTITAGTLAINGTGVLGNGYYAGAIANGGDLVLNTSSNQTLSGIISGSGSLTKGGPGTLTLATATNTFTGALNINGGTLILPGGTNSSFLTGNPNIFVNAGATLGFSNYNSFGQTTSAMSAVTANGGTILSSNTTILFNNLTLNGGTASINGSDNYGSYGSFGLAGTTTATGNAVINAIAGNTGTVGNSNGYSPTFTVLTPAATDSLTVSAVIANDSGTESLVKQGSGMLTLSGVNTYTGTTSVSGGTLLLDFSNLASPTNLINNASALNMGGTLSINGKAASTTAQTFASLAVSGSGVSTISLIANGGGTTTLTITSSAVTRGNGGVLNFVLPASTSVAWNAALSNGILGPGFTIGSGTATQYATVSGGTIAAYNGAAPLVAGNNPAANYTATGNLSLSASTYVNTILYTGSSGTLDNPGQNIGFNGLIAAGAAGTTLTLGPGAAAITDGSVGGTTSFHDIVITGPQNVTVPVNFSGNMANASQLTYSGGGILTLAYTGMNSVSALNVSGGTVVSYGGINAPTINAAAALQFGDGTSGHDGYAIGNPNITDNGALIYNLNGAATYAGAIGGNGSLSKMGTGTLLLSGMNAYGGPTSVSGGTLQMRSAGSFPAGAVARYTFAGNTVDSSSNALNATVQNSPGTYTSGAPSGQAIALNGTSQYLTIPYNAALALNAYTVSTWVNVAVQPGVGGSPALLSTRNGGDHTFDLQYSEASTTSYSLHADLGTGGGWSNTSANVPLSGALTGWNMITLSVNSSGYTYYLNGLPLSGGTGSAGSTPLLMQAGQTLSLGGQEGGGSSYGSFLNGSMADAAVFNSVLSAAAVSSLYQSESGSLPGATTLSVSSGATWNLNGGGQAVTGLSGSGNILLGAGGLLVVNAASNSTFGGIISDGGLGGSLTLAGSATLTLTGNNTYNGPTTITAGTLQIGGGSSGEHLSSPTISDNGGLVFNHTDSLNYSGVISGTGNLTKTGSGMLTLPSANSFTGNITISGGTVQDTISENVSSPAVGGLGNPSTAGRTITINNAGTLAFGSPGGNALGTGTSTPSLALVINAGGQVVVSAAAGSANNVLGNMTLNGGTLTTGTGINSQYQSYEFGGTVTVGGGSASTIAAGSTSNGGINLGINASSGYQTNFNIGSTGGGGPDLTVSAPLGNSANNAVAGLLKTGPGMMALTAVNTYSGTTTVSAGTLQVGNGTSGNDGYIAGPSIVNNSALNFNTGVSQGYTGVISGSGVLSKTGPGTLILGSTNSYSGPTVIGGGTLKLVGQPSTIGTGSFAIQQSNPTFSLLSNDLIQGLTPSANNNPAAGLESSGGVGVLTDGVIGPTTGATNTARYTIGNNTSLTYSLSGSATGYDLSNISLYSVWNDNGRSKITISSISYSSIANPSIFITIPNSSLNFSPSGGYGLAALTATGGVLASGVADIQFNFGSQESNYVGYGELEVVGTTTPSSSNILPISTALTIAASSTLDLAGGNQQIASLGNVNGSGGSVINSQTSSLSVLTITPTALSSFAGNLLNGSGTLGLSINGTSTQVLTGSNGFTGPTNVFAGTLALTGSASLASKAIYIASGAVLDVSALNSTFSVNPGTTLTLGRTTAPASDLLGSLALSGGTINIGGTSNVATATFGNNLSLGGGAMAFDLSNSATAGNDLVNVGGNLSLSSTTSIVVHEMNPALGNGNYPLFSFSGSLTGTPSSALSLAGNALTSRQTAIFTTSGSTVYLDVIGGPQTLTWAGGAGSVWNNVTSNYVWTNSSSASDIFVLADNVSFNNANSNTTVNVGDSVSPGSITVSGSQNYTFSGSGSIGGPASSLTMNGSGVLTIATSGNSYGAGTLLNSGTIAQGVANALPAAGPLTIASGAAFDLAGFSAQAGPLSGAGLITTSATSGTNTFTTNTTSTTTFSGIISDGSQAALALQLAGSGMLVLTGSNNYSGPTLISGGTLMVARSDNSTLTGNISGSGSLAQAGVSLLTLTGSNNYGSTTISNGTLQIGAGGATGSLGVGAVVNNTALVFNRSNGISVSNVIGGSGSLIQAGSGTLTLQASNTYTGTTTLAAGVLNLGVAEIANTSGPLGKSATNNPGSIVLNGGFLQYSAANQNDYSSRFSTAAYQQYDVDTNGQSVTWATPLTSLGGSLDKTGSGTLSLSATNTYAGGTTINGGTLRFVNGALPTTIAFSNNSTLQWASGNTQDVSAQIQPIPSGVTASFDTQTNIVTLGSPLTGSGGIARVGTGGLLVLANTNNSYAGNTTLTGGTLGISSLLELGSGSLTFNGGVLQITGTALANLDSATYNPSSFNGGFDIPTGNTFTVNQNLAGSGSLSKADGGRLVLTGTNSFSGTTTVSGGALIYSSTAAVANLGVRNLSVAGGAAVGTQYPVNQAFLQQIASGSLGTSFVVALAGSSGNNLDFSSSGGSLSLASLGAVGSQTYSGVLTPSGGTAGSYRLGGGGGTLTFPPAISGSATLSIVGAGMVVLPTANSYTGATTISGGVAQLANQAGIPDNTALTLSGGTLDLNGFSKTLNSATGLTGGAVTNTNQGTLSLLNLSPTAPGAASGEAVVNTFFSDSGSGTLALLVTSNSGSGIQLPIANAFSGGLNVNNSYVRLGNAAAAGTGTITISNSAFVELWWNTGSGTISNNFVLNSPGGHQAAGSQAYAKDAIYGDGAGGGYGTYTLSGSISLLSSAGFGGANNLNLTGPVSGTGGLLVAPAIGTWPVAGGNTVTLSNSANSYQGGTVVNVGTLKQGASGAIPSGPGTGDMTVNSGATFNLGGFDTPLNGLWGSGTVTNSATSGNNLLTVGNNNVTSTFGGVIQNPSGSTISLTKAGSGSLTLSGNNTFSGPTSISGGTLQVANAQALGNSPSSLSVAAGATLNVNAPANTGLAWIYYGATPGNQATFAGPLSGIQSAVSTITPTSITNITSLGALPFGTATYTQGTGSGMIDIATSGTYTFQRTNADDDAAIFIDGQAVVPGVPTSNGSPWAQGATAGSITLSAGYHNIVVPWYQGYGSEFFQIQWSGPDTGSTLVNLATSSSANLTPDLYVANLSGSGNVALNTGNLFAGYNNSSTSFAGAISGIGALNKWGTGTLTLAGSGTFSGNTTVLAGLLDLANNTALQNSTLTSGGITFDSSVSSRPFVLGGLSGSNSIALVDNATSPNPVSLAVGNNNSNTTYSGALSGGGGVTKLGSGTLLLSGPASTYTGGTTVSAGKLQLGSVTALGATSGVSIAGGAVLDLNGFGPTIGSLNGAGFVDDVTAGGSATLTIGNGNVGGSFAGIIQNTTGSIAVSKVGSGMQTFSGANTYTGGTSVSNGTLQLGDGVVNNGSVAGNVADNAMLVFANPLAQTFGGVISGSGSLNASGPGGLTLVGSNNYFGGTNVSGGTLNINADAGLGYSSGTLTFAGNGSLQAGAANVAINGGRPIVINSGVTGTFDTNGDTMTVPATISGSGGLAKAGAGLLLLSGTNTYSAGTYVGGGTLQVGNNYALGGGGLTANAGTVDLAGNSPTVTSLSGAAGTITVSGIANSTLTVNQTGSTTFSGSLNDGPSAKLALTMDGPGTLTLTGTSSMSHSTNIYGGVLAVTGSLTVPNFNVNSGQIAGSGVINVTSAGGGFLYASSATSVYSGAISGAGGVEIDSGNLTLSGSSNYSRPTALDGGVLAASSDFALSPNSAVTVSSGTLDVTAAPQAIGSLAVGNSGTLNLSIGNLLMSTGTASFASGSTLNLSGSIGALPELLMTYSGSPGGAFTNVNYGSSTLLAQGDALQYSSGSLDIISAAVFSGSATWVSSGGSLWSNGSNWADASSLNGVPGTSLSRTADTAAFNGSSSVTAITLDVNPSLAALSFSGSNYTLNGGTLTLNNGSGTATVLVASSTQTITGALVLASSSSFQPDAASVLNLTGPISGSGALALDGSGELILSGSNSYTGGTYVHSGTLIATANGAIPEGSSLTVGDGAAALFASIAAPESSPLVASSHEVVAVPEPGTIALLLAALWSAAIYCRFRRPKAFGER